MSYRNKLKQLVEDIDGCNASFFCGYDGILIDQFKKIETLPLDSLGANWADICKKINGNEFKELFVTFNSDIIAIKPFEIGFVGLVLSPDGNVGRAKFELNKCRSDFGL